MTDRLSPRGPDASGYWITPRAAFGHRRLIVVDPVGGVQPMVRTRGNRQFVLVYNGELYNTAEVRTDLIAKGHHFQSYSDTEVVLEGFIEWGQECVQHFNGIFAFGVWEDGTESLFLARDRLGVKPLFYAQRGTTFCFASELKGLLANPLIKTEVSADGLREVFGLGPARIPGSGVFHDVFELRPGQVALYDRRGLRIQKYWSLKSQPHLDNLATTEAIVRELVVDSIKRQLVSDVPVCTLLSGGLDSSIITAIAAEQERSINGRLQTFSVDFVDNDRYFQPNDFQPNSDQPWITMVSEYAGTEHQAILFDNEQLVAALEAAVLARDLPGMADIDASLYLFCREIKRTATVALSGECADEIFGGYPWFYREDALNARTFPWAPSLTLREQILAPELKAELNLAEFVNQKYQDSLREVPLLVGESSFEDRRRELFYLNFNWFMALLLDRKDRMSMASGLEVRVPFCDHRLVEYVWNIPWAFKNCDQREKGILRRAARGLLPEEVLNRRKSPYPKTHHPGYLRLLQNVLQTILEDPTAMLPELIDVRFLKEQFLSGEVKTSRPWFGQLMTGPQLLAYLIQIELWFKRYRVSLR